MDIKDTEESVKRKGRYVDFKEAFHIQTYDPLKYLYYFKQFTNLFDIEFFIHKLHSNAHSLAGLEMHVNSGLQFWEDREASYFVSDDYREVDPDKQYSTQSGEIGTASKNVLARKVTERVAAEKRFKV